MKQCSLCHEIKDLTDFHRRAKAADGRQSRCKACVKQFDAERYGRDHEHMNRVRREHHHANREAECERMRGWYANNRESEQARARQYYADNREERLAYVKEYRAAKKSEGS
jgi:hypothetical protein